LNGTALRYLSCKSVLLASCALATVFAPFATCDTVSLTTSGNTIGTNAVSFDFTGASVTGLSSFPAVLDKSGLTAGLANDSLGYFKFNSTTGVNQNVVDLSVTPTVNGKTDAAPLVFKGTLDITVIGGNLFGSLDFSSTPGAHADVYNTVDYTALTFDGYDFAVKTDFQLASGSGNKQTWVSGYVAPMVSAVPEPLSAATTGLAILALLGIALRRKLRSADRN